MKVETLLAEAARRGIELTVEAGALRYRAPQGALTSELRAQLLAHKGALLTALSSRAGVAVCPPADLASLAAGDGARQQLARWALEHGCPALRLRAWATVVGTPVGWFTFLRTASDAEVATALEAVRERERTEETGG